jgi:hypothetical protein
LSGRLSFDEGVPTPEVGFPKVVVGLGGGRQAPQQSRHIQPPKGSRQSIGFRGRSRGAQPGIATEAV